MSRTRPASGATRHVRGLVVALACLTATAALHAAAGGSVPPLGLLLAGAVAYALGTSVSGRRPSSLPVAVAAIAGCQALMHVVLTFAGSHAGHGSLVPSGPMLAAHVLAAVATAVVLVRADDLAQRWVAFWQALRSPIPTLVAIRPTDTQPVPPPVAVLVSSVHVGTVRRRGPPRP